MGFVKEFFQFAWKEKKYWLIPMILMLVVLSLFVLFFQSAAVVPFIYALF
jgi:competence protein ComGC